MKRISKLIFCILSVIVLSLSFSACDFIKINNTVTSTSSSKPVLSATLPTSYDLGKTYNVESVELSTATNGASEMTSIDAIASVYESVVVIESVVDGEIGVGSGVIIDVDVTYSSAVTDKDYFVYIATCHHVIDGASAFEVFVPHKTNEESYRYYDYAFTGSLIGGDKDSDVAVVRINLKEHPEYGLTQDDITKVTINNDTIVRGQSVFAIGTPLGALPGTVTEGIISNINVNVAVDGIGEMKLLQIDSAINQGNSGGGLFNRYGQLIGLVNAGVIDYDGLGFAVPIKGENGVENIVNELIYTQTEGHHGYVTGRWILGATFVERFSALYVDELSTDSCLKKAGVSAGDRITKVVYNNGTEDVTCAISSLDDFTEAYYDMKDCLTAGDTFKITVDGSVKTVTLEQYIYNNVAE